MVDGIVTLSDIEQHEITKWVAEQLRRLEHLVIEHGSDEELLRVLEYLQDENDRWRIADVEELERSGQMSLPGSETRPH